MAEQEKPIEAYLRRPSIQEALPGRIKGPGRIAAVRPLFGKTTAGGKAASSLADLLLKIATKLVNIAPARIDQAIAESLKLLGEYAGVDRSYIFLFSPDGKQMSNVYEWCAAGITPEMSRLQGLPVDRFPWFMRNIKQSRAVHIPRVQDLPPDARAEKEEFILEDIKSLINVPMVYRQTVFGFLGFDSVRAEKVWPAEIVSLLRTAGALFVGVLQRKTAEQSIRASRARYRRLFKHSPISLWEEDLSEVKAYLDRLRQRGVTDFRAYFLEHPEETARCAALIKALDVNIATLRIYGARSKREFFDGLPRVFTDDSYAAFGKALCEFIDGKNAVELETVNKTLTGKTRNIALKLFLAPGHEATMTRVFAAIEDITERKLAENALRESEGRWRSLIQAAPAVILALTPDHKIFEFNPEAERLYGVKREDVLGRDYFELFLPKEVWTPVAADMRKVLEGKRTKGFENPVRAADGSERLMAWYVNRVLDAGGKPRGVVAIGQDVTEHRRAAGLSDALNEINMNLTSTFDVDKILGDVVGSAAGAIGCETGAMALRAADRWTLKHVYRMPADFTEREFRREELPILGLAGHGRRPICVHNARTDPRVNPELLPNAMNSILVVPLVVKDDLIGAFLFYYRSPAPVFTESQIDFADKLATSVSLAIENARSYDALQQALADSAVLGRVAARTSGTLEFDKILDTALDEVLAAIGTAHGCIYVIDERDQLVIRTQRNLTESFLKAKSVLGLGEGCAGKAALDRQTFAPTAEEHRYVCAESEQLLGLDCLAALPIVARGKSLGVLELFAPVARRLSSREVELTEAISDQLATAIQNAQSYETTQRALADAETLSRVAARISQTLELQSILDTALDETLAALDIRHGCVYLAEDGKLAIKTHRRLSPEFLAVKTVIGPGEGCAGESAVTHNMFAPTVEERRFVCAESEQLLGLDCMAAVPIVYRGETLGVLELFAPVARRLSPREREVAQGISNQLATAIQNARLYGQERNIAKTLQDALLKLPEKIPGVNFGRLYQSATEEAAEVGGDFYDVFALPDGKIGLIIGDVSGKGLAAAALTSIVKNTLRAYAYQQDSPAAAMAKTNKLVCATTRQFVTVFFGLLDVADGKLVYCSAGHPEAVIKRSETDVSILPTRSPAVGLFDYLNFMEDVATFNKGDILVLYTDGATEARRDTELFGEKRLFDLIKRLRGVSAATLPRAIFNEVLGFTGGRLADDIAILTVERE